MYHLNLNSNFTLCLDSEHPGLKYLIQGKWVRSCEFIPIRGSVNASPIYTVTSEFGSRQLYKGPSLEDAQKVQTKFDQACIAEGDPRRATLNKGPHLLQAHSFRLQTGRRLGIEAEPDTSQQCLLCIGEGSTSKIEVAYFSTEGQIMLKFENRRGGAKERRDLVVLLEPGQNTTFGFRDNRGRETSKIYRWDGTAITVDWTFQLQRALTQCPGYFAMMILQNWWVYCKTKSKLN